MRATGNESEKALTRLSAKRRNSGDRKPRSESPGDLAVAVFSRVVCLVLIAIVVITIIRGYTGVTNVFKPVVSEVRYHRAKFYDHVLYLTALGIGVVVFATARFRVLRSAWFKWPIATIAGVGLSLGIFAVEEPGLVHKGQWGGFGPSECLAVVVALPLVWSLLDWDSLKSWMKRTFTVLMVLLSVADLVDVYRPSFMTGTWGVNDAFIVNDVLAQSAGRIPDHNYIGEYEVMFGWILKPLSSFLSVGELTAAASLLLNLVTYGAVVGAVVVVYRLFQRRSIGLALLFVVPLMVVSVANHPLQNTLGAYQLLPTRIAPSLILAAVTLEDLVRLRSGRARSKVLFAEGVFGAFIAWSNQDYCLLALATLGLLFVLSSTRRFSGPKVTAPWGLGLVAGLVGYPLLLAILGAPIRLRYLFFFQTLFGKNGYLSFPIQVPGPVLFVLPVCIAAGTAGIYGLRRPPGVGAPRVEPENIDRASLTAAFFGVFTSLALIYYISQSVATGPLESLMMPMEIAVAAVVAMMWPHTRDYVRGSRQVVRALWVNGPFVPWIPGAGFGVGVYFLSGSVFGSVVGLAVGFLLVALVRLYWSGSRRKTRLDGKSTPSWKAWYLVIPLAVAASLPLAAIVQTPNVYKTVTNLIHPPRHTAIVWPSTTGIAKAKRIAAARHESLQYFGEFGNYVELATGVSQVSIVDVPPAAPGNYKQSSADCVYLASHPSDLLVTDPTTASLYGQTICRTYHQMAEPAIAPDVLYRRVGTPGS